MNSTSVQIERLETADIDGLASLRKPLVEHDPDLATMRNAFCDATENHNHLLFGAKDSQGKQVGSGVGILCETLVARCQPRAFGRAVTCC